MALLFKVATVIAVSGLLARRPLRARGLAPSAWTGVGWLALSILAEMVVGASARPGWSELLGNMSVPWMRNVLMLSWLVAPALFSHETLRGGGSRDTAAR